MVKGNPNPNHKEIHHTHPDSCCGEKKKAAEEEENKNHQGHRKIRILIFC